MTTTNPLLTVTAAEYVSDYTLRLTFSTGEVLHRRLERRNRFRSRTAL
jgi:hypothetical protein